MSYELLFAAIGVQIPLLLAFWHGLNAEARLLADQDEDVKDAQAGFHAGLLDPALAHLIEQVVGIQRQNEGISDALMRSDVTGHVREVTDAASRKAEPRNLFKRLIRGWTWLAWSIVVLDVAGITLSVNAIANQHIVGGIIPTVALVTVSISGAATGGAAMYVRYLARALGRSIADGKRVADGTGLGS